MASINTFLRTLTVSASFRTSLPPSEFAVQSLEPGLLEIAPLSQQVWAEERSPQLQQTRVPFGHTATRLVGRRASTPTSLVVRCDSPAVRQEAAVRGLVRSSPTSNLPPLWSQGLRPARRSRFRGPRLLRIRIQPGPV